MLHRHRPGRQRAAAARRADDRREPARQRAHRGQVAGAGRAASTTWWSATATGRRSACWRCRAPPTTKVETYPLDVLGAQTEGHDRLHDRAGARQPAAVRAAVRHPADDGRGRRRRTRPSRTRPSSSARCTRRTRPSAWPPKRAGSSSRTATSGAASSPRPSPKRIFELRPIKWLLEQHTIVIAAGGGGIPAVYEPGAERKLVGIECVIDKDLRDRAAGARTRRRPAT